MGAIHSKVLFDLAVGLFELEPMKWPRPRRTAASVAMEDIVSITACHRKLYMYI
jgi:hypothetical protein